MKFKCILAAFAVMFVATLANAQLGTPSALLSYTLGSGYAYTVYGTNDNVGYTNAVKYIDVSQGTLVNFMLHSQGTGTDTNAKVLVIKSAYGASTDKTATSSVAGGNQTWRISLPPTTATAVNVTTNITTVGAPFLSVTVESAGDVGTTTNLVLYYTVKAN